MTAILAVKRRLRMIKFASQMRRICVANAAYLRRKFNPFFSSDTWLHAPHHAFQSNDTWLKQLTLLALYHY
jgi:hypothetical protein